MTDITRLKAIYTKNILSALPLWHELPQSMQTVLTPIKSILFRKNGALKANTFRNIEYSIEFLLDLVLPIMVDGREGVTPAVDAYNTMGEETRTMFVAGLHQGALLWVSMYPRGRRDNEDAHLDN